MRLVCCCSSFLVCWFLLWGAEKQMEVCASDIGRKSFPEGFVFGTAASAYQVEGAINQDNRGKSIWDTFSHQLGHVLDLSNGDITDDEYNLYKDDINLLEDMGVDVYRFSISWSRIYPDGDGDINLLGVNHYNDLINALLFKGIEPYVTLYHWDLPQALQDKYNGWLSDKIIGDFLIYADTCFNAFGDRVKHWITFNEPYEFTLQGFGGLGTQAPGRCSVDVKCDGGNSTIEPYIVAKNVLFAHARAVSLYKEKYQGQQKGVIGITLDSRWYEPRDNKSEDDYRASKRALDFQLGWFLDPLIFGDYPSTMIDLVSNRLPSLSNNTITLKNSFDFIGLNHYTTNYVYAGKPTYITAALSNINPDGQFETTGYADLNLSPFNISSQPLEDDERIAYHKAYLSNLLFAIKSGSRVKGYIIWSLLDNWEWGLGFTARFGLYFVDYENNLQRYPKKSTQWFKKFLKN